MPTDDNLRACVRHGSLLAICFFFSSCADDPGSASRVGEPAGGATTGGSVGIGGDAGALGSGGAGLGGAAAGGGSGVGGSVAGAPGSGGDGAGGVAGGGSGGAAAAGGSPAAGGGPGSGGGPSSGGMPGSGGQGSGGAGAAGCDGGQTPDFSLVGWATQNGGTTGGKGGSTVTVSNGAQLVQALADKQDSATPLTILVSGTITEANSGVNKIDVKDVSDVSILGTGAGAEFDGIGIKIVRASNIVLRNLRVHHVDIGDKDAISIEGPADHIWVDHCELYADYQGTDKDYYDGLLDAKAEAEYLTYSWNYLHDSWKTALAGSSESDTFDRKLTLHHNYFRNCNSRMPLFRGGTGHVFNNYYVDIADTGINARLNACLRIENNFFENAQNPYVSAFSDVLGGGELLCNVLSGTTAFVYSDDVRELPACVASVPYAYGQVLTHPDSVPSVVSTHAGVGQLDDPTDF